MGMAEVSLTLVDPEVYGDVTEPEVDVQDDLPDEWDESALRAASAEDAERYTEEIRPGQTDEEVPATPEAAMPRPPQQMALPFLTSCSRFAAASSSAPSRPARSWSRAACSAPARANIC